MDNTDTEIVNEEVGGAGDDASLPHIYANAYKVVLSSSDIGLVPLRNDVPQVSVSMSFTTAKSLLRILGRALMRLEEGTGKEIMTSDQVAEGLNNLDKKDAMAGSLQ